MNPIIFQKVVTIQKAKECDYVTRPVTYGNDCALYTFPAILTENSLLSSPPPSSESSFSTTSVIISESPANLVHIYDNTFPNLQQHHNFTNRKLIPWKQSLDF